MKKTLLLLMLMGGYVFTLHAQYPQVTVRQIQEDPIDSLQAADAIPNFSANSSQPRWTLQASPYLGDTVTVTAVCVAPPGVVTFTVGKWAMLVYDTGAVSQWGGILVRGNAPQDTAALIAAGFLNVQAGDVITFTGVIGEFPSGLGFSFTQIQPVANKPISIIGTAPLPRPIVKNIGDFYQGIFPSGKVQVTTGEPFEALFVEFHNVTIDNKVNQPRGTFSVVDESGNEISEYDCSHFFTLGHGSSILVPGDTAWARIYSGIGNGRRIDTLRGIIVTSAGQEGPRGYRIAPLYPGDIVFSNLPPPPIVTSHRRYPVKVTPDTGATISVKINQQPGGSLPDTAWVKYALNASTNFTKVVMNYQASDTTYVGTIPKQANNTFVRYFVEVVDTGGQVVRLANSATSGISSDTSKGMFFYTSLTRALTIKDVQYTPYINGRTPYLGAVATLAGTVTADTVHIGLSALNTGGTSAWYMQNGNAPWSGIWVTAADSASQAQLAAVRNGDSIAVTGTVQEQFDVTRLGNVTAVTRLTSGNPEPPAVVRTTGSLNVGNGTPSAEAYEGMLVQLNNLTVTNINPTFSDQTEYTVDDGSGGVLVRRDGLNSYSNMIQDTAFGKLILQVGSRIGSLTGIVYYSFNQYKITPRTDADFQNVVLTGVTPGGSVDIPLRYTLAQNYPNPFNPSTVIEYDLAAAGQVSLKIYNVLGQEVKDLVHSVEPAGRHSVRFDAGTLSTGVYFYRLQAGPFMQVKKMLLVK